MTRNDKALYLSVLKLLALRSAQLAVILISVLLLAFVAFYTLGQGQ